jgi:hypothetical protein
MGCRLPDRKYGFSKVISTSLLEYNLAGWNILLQNLPAGISEIVVHPGLPGNDPNDKPKFRARRVLEYELFRDSRTKQLCKELGIELVSYETV